MNKIKQNKITFFLILSVIVITFSSLTILSLPVLFNYKSKVLVIEKNFYESFKIYMNSSGNISYKPFPKPHLIVENATLNLIKSQKKDDLISTSNLKIFISLRDIYLRSFNNLLYTEISDTNISVKILEKKLSIVSHKVQTTRFRLNGILCERESQIAFIDTPGICDAKSLRERSYNKVAWQCIYDTNIVALVIDAKKGINNQTELIYKRLKSNFLSKFSLTVHYFRYWRLFFLLEIHF